MKFDILKLAVFAILLSIGLSGCKTKKKLVDLTIEPLGNSYLNDRLRIINNEYEWIKLKARIRYADSEHSFKGTAHIRSKKDSLIWIRITKLGIEGARMVISKDSIKILNRIDKNYELKDFKGIDQKFGVMLGLNFFEDALVANPMILDTSTFDSSIDPTGYVLRQESDQTTITYHLRPQDLLIDWLKVAQTDDSQLEVTHSDYDSRDSTFIIPKKRIITGMDKNNHNLQVEFKIISYELNKPTAMSFNIPSHYALKN